MVSFHDYPVMLGDLKEPGMMYLPIKCGRF